MIIFIEGLQTVGKSSLIKELKFKKARFNFIKYVDLYNLKSSEALKGFQLGKDLGMLFLSDIFTDDDVVLDRGPLSTLYYSLSENRLPINEICFLIENISKSKNVFIWIEKINNNEVVKRERNDGWDWLDDENNVNSEKNKIILFRLLKSYHIPVYTFENDFSKPIEENGKKLNKLIQEIINEHVRN